MSPSPAAGAVSPLQSSKPCGHFTGKHHFKVDSFYSGHFAVLKCAWTLCQSFKVVPHEELVKLVTA